MVVCWGGGQRGFDPGKAEIIQIENCHQRCFDCIWFSFVCKVPFCGVFFILNEELPLALTYRNLCFSFFLKNLFPKLFFGVIFLSSSLFVFIFHWVSGFHFGIFLSPSVSWLLTASPSLPFPLSLHVFLFLSSSCSLLPAASHSPSHSFTQPSPPPPPSLMCVSLSQPSSFPPAHPPPSPYLSFTLPLPYIFSFFFFFSSPSSLSLDSCRL